MSPWPSRPIKIPLKDVSLDELQRAFLALWKVQSGLQLEDGEGLLIDKALWHCRLAHERERWEGVPAPTEPEKEQP
jgi:hypothetical protein